MSGNDGNNGTSSLAPWRTITKVNSAFSIIKPGDRILFNRGDTFYGTIIVTKTGSVANPIVIGPYGTGANPVITGFTTVTGWTNEGNGIYSKVLASEAQTNMVSMDGINICMGRYPKSTYQTYESFASNVSITDNGLGDFTNWTGAEVVIRKNDWTLDRCLITKHTGDILTYTSLGTNQNSTANYGYFIQNDLRCVTKLGDWYHNKSTGKFYMYFGTIDPVTKTVKVATLKNLVTNQNGADYLTINNISLSGSIENVVNYTWQNDHCLINSCNISFAGQDGIRLFGDFGTVDNNQITFCNAYGIYSYGTNTLITNNALTNLNTIAGQSKGWLEYTGIYVEKNDCIIQYNRIENVGYNGISLGVNANNITIQNNFITNSCLILNDGAGIYLGGTHTSIKIDGNIILNTIGNNTGTLNKTLMAEGIYLDESANHITVINNTISGCLNSGIKLHKAHDNTVQNNTSFNNYTGIDFENWTGTSTIYNNSITGNIFFAKSSSQFCLRFSSVTNDIPAFGTAGNNYYLRPIDDNYVIYTNQTSIGPKNRTLSDWQLFTKQDASSHKSPITLTNTNDIRFEYNELKTNKIVILEKPMIDVKGTKYFNSVTLLPFTSVVLMVDPNPVQPVIPVYTGSVIENVSPSTLEMTFDLNLASILPAISAFFVQVNGLNRNVNSIVISGNKVRLIIASNVVFGDKITITYIKPGTNWLQAISGGAAASISSQPVTNNCIKSIKSNNLPILVIKNELNSYSGFVGEIDVSESYDSDNDILSYEWNVPENVSVSSASNSRIQFLSPIVDAERNLEFQLKVTDGIDIISRSIYVNILPYKPELTEGKIKNIEAGSYTTPDFPENVADGNMATKWSANGYNNWLLLYLTDPFEISHLQIAFLPGQKYESYFDILVSKDNLTWESIFTRAASCNFSGDIQVFEFPDVKGETEYSYVKLIGQGNSMNTLNTFSEFKIFGMPGPSVIAGNNETKISIYPNPASDFLNISINQIVQIPQIVKIIDSSGIIVFTCPVEPGMTNLHIPLGLIPGIYIIVLATGNLPVFAQKLIIRQ
jgi:parallel beta-helix repeat protein